MGFYPTGILSRCDIENSCLNWVSNYMQMLSLTFLKDLLVSVHTGRCAQGSQTAAIPAGGGGNIQASLARAQGIQS